MTINRTILFGIALIVLGIVAFAQTSRDVANLGPIQVSVERSRTDSLVPLFGALVLAGGIVLVAAEAMKSWKKAK